MGKRHYSTYLNKIILTSFHFKVIDESEVKKIIKDMQAKTSVGFDGISSKLLKYIAPAIIAPLTMIINQSLILGIFPERLKLAKVVPIYKKNEAHNLTNYRPVSLLIAISKVFEKAVHKQLYEYFNINKLFFPSQYGFRKDHSTEYASLELIDRALQATDNRDCMLITFMDLSKAFDTLDHSIMINKLRYYGVDPIALKWFSSYLTSRKQYTVIDNVCSEQMTVKTGVPQGSILGPLLFLIYVNDMPHSSIFFEHILYADDTSLIKTVNRNTVFTEINDNLTNITDWMAVNRLSLNIPKTKFMMIRTQNKDISFAPNNLTINGTYIEKEENFNYLGTLINEHLSWKPHCDMLANKISKTIGVLNRLKRYTPTNILRTLYCSMVQSHFNYTILAWGNECSRLEKLQNKAIRIISLSRYNADTKPLFKSLGLLSIRDIFRLQSLKFFYKYTNKTVPTYFLDYSYEPNSSRHNHDTRHKELIPANVTRLQQTQNSIRNYLHKVINETDNCILEKISSVSLQGFANILKRKYLENYSNGS